MSKSCKQNGIRYDPRIKLLQVLIIGVLVFTLTGKKYEVLLFLSVFAYGMMSIPACFIPSFRREDTANPVDKIPQFREWSTIIPELDTADFLNLYTVFMRFTA